MRVELQLFATLVPFLPADARARGVAPVEARDGSTLRDVLALLGIPPEFPLVALVNGHDAAPERRLCEGDVVSLFPPLAGGR